MSPLKVSLFDRPAGTLWREDGLDAPEDWRFRYDAAYVDAPSAVPLSCSLPLRSDRFEGAVVRNWFCNLLPEGLVRDAIVQRLRLPQRDDLALLAAIGGECAGAVAVLPDGAAPAPAQADPIELEALIGAADGALGEGDWGALGGPHRLSLAGAQDKLAVVRMADGRLRLPARGEPTTHLIKPDSQRFPGLRDLEALGLSLARHVGLPVPDFALIEVMNRRALLLTRYDRVPSANDGQPQRLHQEDFCQALGYPGELKYQSQGGPSLAQCAQLIRTGRRLGPQAVSAFLDWVIVTVLIGNADAHAKNLALLCDASGRWSLAPFYDLVPTLVLPESLVERTPALRIGQATRIDSVSAEDWTLFARETGYGPVYVRRRVAQLAERMAQAMQAACTALVDQGGDRQRLERACAIIAAQIGRVSAAV
ncbi:MAG: type II toxin-antitoxin system HipA family toxin [Lysobacterales bacterium]